MISATDREHWASGMRNHFVRRCSLEVRGCSQETTRSITNAEDDQVRIALLRDFQYLLGWMAKSHNRFRTAPQLSIRRDDVVQMIECIRPGDIGGLTRRPRGRFIYHVHQHQLGIVLLRHRDRIGRGRE